MPRLSALFIATSAAALLSACAIRPDSYFVPTTYAENRNPIMIDGVAVLTEPPACNYIELGRAYAATWHLEATEDTVNMLKAEAAMYGAEAIILHPNIPDCPEGSKFEICYGRGDYLEATAITYPLEPDELAYDGTLEMQPENGYDNSVPAAPAQP